MQHTPLSQSMAILGTHMKLVSADCKRRCASSKVSLLAPVARSGLQTAKECPGTLAMGMPR